MKTRRQEIIEEARAFAHVSIDAPDEDVVESVEDVTGFTLGRGEESLAIREYDEEVARILR